MRVTERPSLKAFNTFGIEASAGLMLTLESEEDVLALPSFNPRRDLLLGGGSNVLLRTDVPGSVIHNCIKGRDVLRSDQNHAWIEAGAGENWHDLVRWSLGKGFSGLENLSLIPGYAGAAPIQNIGAYGVELSSVLESVTAWDLSRSNWKIFTTRDCRLGYRDSIFKTGEPGRYLITSIQLRLDRRFKPQLAYSGLREELEQSKNPELTARDVSDAVIRLRRRKLPDPAVLGNAGSFFKNPELESGAAEKLTDRFPALPAWRLPDGRVKLSAAWMIEDCGLKGCRDGDAGVSAQHALVIVNHGSATGEDVLALSRTVQSAVRDRFGLMLEAEPGIIEFSG
jgi:UDP-N-acetylmuramate dehydrogenase